MVTQSPVLPWFSPKLSRSMAGVMHGLGHSVLFRRGEVIYQTPGFFSKLMFVRRGLVVKALTDAHHEDPLLISIAGPGTLCGSYETLYLPDQMPRQHWCMTTTEVLVVNAELLLRICDQNAVWQKELYSYSAACALSDRCGLLVNHSVDLETRLGIFFILCASQLDKSFSEGLTTPSVEWLGLSIPPSRRVAASLLNTSSDNIRSVLKLWRDNDVIRFRSHKLLLRREQFFIYWRAVNNLLGTQLSLNESVDR